VPLFLGSRVRVFITQTDALGGSIFSSVDLVTSIILSYERSYQLFFVLQMAFYVWAATGFFFQRHLRRVRFALVGYFLLAMNLAFLVGMYRCLTGRKGAVWQRVS